MLVGLSSPAMLNAMATRKEAVRALFPLLSRLLHFLPGLQLIQAPCSMPNPYLAAWIIDIRKTDPDRCGSLLSRCVQQNASTVL